MSLVKNKNTSYNLYIYSITYTNWVIIKQEGKNKLKQNSIPSLVPGPHFLSIFLRCFLYFVLRSLSISLQRKQVHATCYFPVIRPEQFSSPGGNHSPTLDKLYKEDTLPGCLQNPSFLTRVPLWEASSWLCPRMAASAIERTLSRFTRMA